MTPSDLVARLKDDADYLQTWIDDGLETDFTMDPDGMRNQQKHFRDCAAAIEQLQAELVQAKQAVDCWFEDAKNLAEFKVTVATGINMTLERYRELVEIMEDRDRITGYLRERNQECADLKTERDALRAELEAVKRKIDELFPVIAHGDDKHRAWLTDAIEKHFDAARAQGEK